ncbi:RecQ family ATP-dependent DNA helicase [Actinomycetes bacterium NPDC127524]
MNLHAALNNYFGFKEFRPGQEEIISSLLDGEDTIGMLPTGSGKSLCYQLPAYLLNKTVIIVSPLLSLMQDQAEQLKAGGEKSVLTLNSFLSPIEKRKAIANLHDFRFIFMSPEMLVLEHVKAALMRLDIGLFVIDEAHCISQWGYDFRPEYLELGVIREKLSNPLTLALTATATREVRSDIKEKLGLGSCREVISSVDRANISLIVEKHHSFDDKLNRLIELVKSLQGPGIIYFSSKKAAESSAQKLLEMGIKGVGCYHGGMEQENRILIQQQFLNGQLNIICSTSAFGMGVNKENVRFVIHFHTPASMESYVQEIGRAGRDGLESLAVLLYSDGDEGLPIRLLEQQFPLPAQMEAVFSYIKNNGGNPDVMLQEEERLMMAYSLNETQWGFIKHFIQNNRLKSIGVIQRDMEEYAADRTQYNMKKFHRFFGWLHSSLCRRIGIMQYFEEEQAVRKEKDCCDHCGLRAEDFFKSLPDQGTHGNSLNFSWKEELACFLLLKDVQDEK